MEYKLTCTTQCGKKCPDGKSRNFLLYFLNGELILKQKFPFDPNWEKGFDKQTHIFDEYIQNGKMYQSRYRHKGWKFNEETKKYEEDKTKTRKVSFPLFKNRLEKFNIPNNLIIKL